MYTIDSILKGLIVGIIVSAPMGPVGMLVVRRTLLKGRNYGFVTGVGAAVSDLFYAVLTGIGMGYVMSVLNNETSLLILKLLGSVVLFLFGLYAVRTPVKEGPKPSNKKGNLWQNGVTGFFITVSNPLIVFLFMALIARFDFVSQTQHHEQVLGYLSLFAGAVLWWFFLTTAIKAAVQRFDISHMQQFNRFLGFVVMAVSSIGILFTIIDCIC